MFQNYVLAAITLPIIRDSRSSYSMSPRVQGIDRMEERKCRISVERKRDGPDQYAEFVRLVSVSAAPISLISSEVVIV